MTTRPTRRRFLQAAATAPLAAIGARSLAAGEKKPPIVDTHLHCFAGKDDRRFPYHARATYRPAAAATPQHLIECMDDAEADFAVVVQPFPYHDDHRYLEYCLEVGKGQLKGTCLVFADRPGSVEKLPGMAERIDLVATRIHAYTADHLPPFGKPELRRLWRQAAELGLGVQLHFLPRYAPGFEPLIKQFADTPVYIDHLGRPLQGTPKEHAVVLRWARLKNTVMKLSEMPDASKDPDRRIPSVVKQLTNAYGVERMMFGGGFSARATGASYRAERERVRGTIAHLSTPDQRKILGGTAARLYGFAS